MNRSAILALGLAAALACIASPAVAQHRREGGENRGGGARGGGSPRAEQHAERQAPPPQAQGQAQPRAEARPQPQSEQRADPRAVPRQYAQPRYVGPRGNYNAAVPRYYTGRYYGPRYVGPRFSVAPRVFIRPYYVFRPRFNITFGIWAGYPITYYDPFYYPYDYYSYYSPGPVPVPPAGSVAVQPTQSNMGGVSFEMTPATAEIWIDGNYYGTANQFTAASQPLGLPVGRHHIELREPGYQVSAFDVDIVAGQVIPFQGQLEP